MEELEAEIWTRDKVDSGLSTYNKINAFTRNDWFKLMEEYHQYKLKLLGLADVCTRYLLIKWIHGHPIIDGAKYADTKEDLYNYYNSLPKIKGVEYTICEIYNVC